ncbi:MAG: ATP-binding protein [Pseudomonadota bacterium]
MIPRLRTPEILAALDREAAVALIGPRQVGKTTLALEIAADRTSIYLDLESREDRAKLSDPAAYLAGHADKLVVLDEIHRVPDLFEALRGIIDQGRRAGQGTGRFLLLGSASIDLMRQSETLAGRIEFVDLTPLSADEIASEDINTLWLRGGFPRAFLSGSDKDSHLWRRNFIRTYLERDVPMFGPRVPAETLERFWTMLAHSQGGLLNAAQLGRSLGVSSPTIASYIDLLVDLLLVRRLPPVHANVGKRLVKSPKVYVRDSGLVHALLGLRDVDALLGHPIAGASWEVFAIENLLAACTEVVTPGFYRTSGGAELDLVLDFGPTHGRWAIEIKRSTAPALGKGFHSAIADITPDRAFVVYGWRDRFPITKGVEAIGLRALCEDIRALG